MRWRSAPGRGRVEWGSALGLAGLASAWHLATESVERIATVSHDPDLQFHLSRLTAEGAVPLRDFEHAFNVGTWYFGAGLYYLLGGNRFLWVSFFSVVIPTGVATVVAYLWMRRRGIRRLVAVVVVAAMVLLFPVPNVRYVLPLLAVVFIDTCRRRWGWEAAPFSWCVAATVAVITVFSVDIGVFVGAGVVLFAAVDARADDRGWKVALRRAVLTGAAAGGALLLVLTVEAAILRASGLPVGLFLDQVGFGHTEDLPERYGWALLIPEHPRALFAVLLVGLPLVPGVLRRASSSARLVALMNLVLLVVAIRRSDGPHFGASMTMVPVAWGLTWASLPGDWRAPTLRRLWRVGGAAGALVTVGLLAVVGVGLEIPSLAGAALVLGAASLVVLVAVGLRASEETGAIAGPAAVLVAVTVVGALVTSYSAATDEATLERFVSVQDEARTVLVACEVSSGEAGWIVPGPLSLYEGLGLDNPMPYYRFQYDFPTFEDDVVARLEDGSVPFVLLVGHLTSATSFMGPALRAHYDECATTTHAETGPMFGFRYRG